MLGTTQLNSIVFADYLTFNNIYMKLANTRQKMTNNNNNNKKSLILPTIQVCFPMQQPLL